MKVLQLCNKPPIPRVDGGCIAIHNVSAGLLEKGIELKIVTVSTEKHPFLIDLIPEDFRRQTGIEGIFLDTRVNVIDAFSALVTADSYNVNRFFSPDFNKRLQEILAENSFDVVILETLFMTPYIHTIRQNSKAKIVLRSHNLEHLIWERLAESTGNTAKRMYLKHLASKLKKYEKRTINEVDCIATITKEDTDRFSKLLCEKPMITIPFGIKIKDYPVTENKRTKKNRLFHIGAMNWEPNKEGISWFSDHIWPLVSNTDISFHMAGRSMPPYIHQMANEKIVIHGEVESAQKFMAENDIMVVPLLSGSGMRIKIIEGMAAGKAIISTSVGAEGIDCEHGVNIILADKAKDFAKAILDLTSNPEKVTQLGKNARKLVEEKFDNDVIIQKFVAFLEK
jgi:glycosyltransferase involved in cell wall biosynthesis